MATQSGDVLHDAIKKMIDESSKFGVGAVMVSENGVRNIGHNEIRSPLDMTEQRPNGKSTVKQREPARRTLNQQIDEFFKKGKEVEKVPGFTHVKEK